MILIILGRATHFFLALLMMRVATTLLSPMEMGRIALVTTTTAFFAMFLINPVGMFINRKLHAWRDNGIARYYLIRYVSYLAIISLCAMILLSFLYSEGWLHIGMSLNWLILLVCGSLIFNTINQTSIPSLNLLGDSKRFVLLSIATITASFSFAAVLVHVIRPEAQFWLLGLLAGQVLVGLLGTKIFFKQLKPFETEKQAPVIGKPHLRVLFSFSWPVSLAAGFAWIQAQGYRYLFEGEAGLNQLGMFVAGYGISMGMIAGFESVLTTYFQPRLYKAANDGGVAQQILAWQSYAAAVIPSLILTVGLILSLVPELTKILLGVNFQAAAEFVVWGALAEAARVLAGVYSLIAHVFMQTRWLIVPNFLAAVSAIAASMILIPMFGAKGAGMGLVISGCLMVTCLHFLLAKKVEGGIVIRPVAAALFAIAAMLGATTFVRELLPLSGWPIAIIVTGFTVLAYLMFQYYFLRQHLGGERKKT